MDVEVAPWEGDAETLVGLARSVGWAWSEARARRTQRLAPARAWVAREAGHAVGTISCHVYPDAGRGAFAWVAGMAVRPERRGRGVGARLLDAALAFARENGARSVGLDATPAGEAACRKAGFRVVARDPRLVRDPAAPPVPPAARMGDFSIYPISSCEVMELLAYDAARFGASRATLLAEAMALRPQQCFVAFDRARGNIVGHVLAQEQVLGPLVADTPRAARWLLYAAEMAGAPRAAHVSGLQPGLDEVFAQAGWAEDGSACARMVLGDDPPQEVGAIYALAGWGLG